VTDFPGWDQCFDFEFPLLLSHCWLRDSTGIWPVESCANYLQKFRFECVEAENQAVTSHTTNTYKIANKMADFFLVYQHTAQPL